jgi:hypothetical protein
VSGARTVIPAREVQLGDRLFAPSGHELTVTRIDLAFFGRPELIAFVEDSETQWLKLPLPADTEVEVQRAER